MLNALVLENFKCFRQQEIPLGSLTLLTGLNAMGKSSVLQAMLLLRQSIQEGLLPGEGLLLNGGYLTLGTAENALFRGAENDWIRIGIRADDASHCWQFAYSNPYDDVLRVISEPEVIPDLSILTGEVHYLAAERIGPRALYDASSYAIEQRRDIGADGRYAVAYLDAHATRRSAEAVRHPKATDDSVRSQVASWLGEVSPGAVLRTQPYPELNRLTLAIGFQDAGVQPKFFSAPNVGFGLSYVLPVLVAVIASPPGASVIIENPEAHLHPRGQVALARLLASAAKAGLQVVVETHSDHILNGIRLSVKQGVIAPDAVRVLFFGRRVDEVSSDQFEQFVDAPQIDRNGRIDHWPEGFFDEWERTLDELL